MSCGSAEAGMISKHVQMRRNVAMAIALSLPGSSKLAPYLYQIAGEHVLSNGNSGAPPHSAGFLRLHPRSVVPFLHSFGDWWRHKRALHGDAVPVGGNANYLENDSAVGANTALARKPSPRSRLSDVASAGPTDVRWSNSNG
jgi:hypothetical protein